MLMKKIRSFVLLTGFLLFSFGTFAQGPPPTPPADPSAGGTNGTVGGAAPSAPIGNGTMILFVLAAAYAGRKTYDLRSKPAMEE